MFLAPQKPMVIFGWENFEEGHGVSLFMKGTAQSCPIENITRQKPYNTLFFKRVAVGVRQSCIKQQQ